MAPRAPVFLLLATAAAKKGTDTICLGPRPHVVKYDFTGETLEQVENATISVQPDPTSDLDCSAGQHQGDKTMCVGANVDATCAAAAKDITVDSYVDCPSCFAGLATDLFYSLEIKFFDLEQVEVGLQNSHLRGAAEVHAHAGKAVTLPPGKVTLIGEEAQFTAKFMVAEIIPVDITVSVPTTFNYGVGFKGSIDATAGADLDINLGNHYVKYQKGSGFSVVNDAPSYTFTPKLNLDVEAEADLSLGLESTVAISVDKVVSYDVHMQPSFPLKVDLENQDKNVCIAGSADFVLSHEADVHFSFFGKKHDIFHYGPKQLYHYHKDDVFKKCIDVPRHDAIVV
eukprot:TRINITY_DN2025_c0_g1_i2.p1 TRINITY_DN2025_c0_g1~~TRINITY_DN2025_c0_g1_i2.p1  ORF type:complete len:341 (+),score=84.52 TRINITY_DN2025_c0_g1_i2:84-1106(+)